MEAPKVVLSKPTSESEASAKSRRSSSINAVTGDRTRSSSTASESHASSPQKTDKRKPSMSNPYFHASPRKQSTNNNPRIANETVDYQTSKAREINQRQLGLQPTFRTEPQEDKRFTPHIVKMVMDNALEEALDGMGQYEAAKCKALSVSVCEDIKQKVKWLNYDRYKLICVVYFGSVCGQELRVTSRCLWNDSFDNFASSSIIKGDIYAVALMYGVYKE
jgi:hypothetical protein